MDKNCLFLCVDTVSSRLIASPSFFTTGCLSLPIFYLHIATSRSITGNVPNRSPHLFPKMSFLFCKCCQQGICCTLGFSKESPILDRVSANIWTFSVHSPRNKCIICPWICLQTIRAEMIRSTYFGRVTWRHILEQWDPSPFQMVVGGIGSKQEELIFFLFIH